MVRNLQTHVIDHYTPMYERKPNRNTIQYFKGMIFTTDASENQIFGTLNFHRESADTLKIVASDGKTATYKFLPYEHLTYETSRLQHFQKSPLLFERQPSVISRQKLMNIQNYPPSFRPIIRKILF